jgi:transcriptional regulator with XRE-family HTH domain
VAVGGRTPGLIRRALSSSLLAWSFLLTSGRPVSFERTIRLFRKGTMTPIGTRIRELRTGLGFSQGDIERSTGMVRAYISRVEHGHIVPSVESIGRFATALGIEIHEFFLDGPLELASVGRRNEENPFVLLLSGYVRKMDSARRRMLMSVAERLAKEGRK